MANRAFAYAPIILAMLCVSTVLADTKLGSRSPGYRRQWALVVGINYNELDDRVKSSVRPLENAESDALAFAEVLTTIYGYDPDNVRTLIGDQATSLRVRQALSKDFLANSKEVQEEDSVVFYFAGHGWRDKTLLSDASHVGFLCPSDVDITKEGEIDPATCVSIDLLVGQLRDFCPARHKLVILDCCHSGEIFNFARIRSAGANPRFRAT